MVAELVTVRNGKIQRGPDSITAAARRVTTETIDRLGARTGKDSGGWEADAWELLDLVGEQWFIVNTLAGRVGASRLYAGKTDPDDPTAKPELLEESHKAAKVLAAFGDTPLALSQLLYRMSVNLSVPGTGYYVGVPKQMLEKKKDDDREGITPVGTPEKVTDIDIEDLVWFMLSNDEVKRKGEVFDLSLPDKKLESIDPDTVWMIHTWNAHPRKFNEATSPTRSSLSVLRELAGLTMYVSSQIDSRLTGAGLFFSPQSAHDAVLAQIEDPPEDADPFGDAIMEAGTTAIADRSSAAAMMPIHFVVPDETIEKFRHMSFAVPLDKEARQLREEAIRRLALGQDIPPEVLLGVGGMNHWGAWLVREDTVKTHVEPQLATMCEAITTQYLWPVLEQQGMKADEYQQYVIWYDTDHLISRPNRLEDAIALHAADAISDEALRKAGQFTDEDAKVDMDTADEASSIVLKMVQANASLIRNPGVDALVESIRKLLKGETEEPAPEGEGAPLPPVPPAPTPPQPVPSLPTQGPPSQ